MSDNLAYCHSCGPGYRPGDEGCLHMTGHDPEPSDDY